MWEVAFSSRLFIRKEKIIAPCRTHGLSSLHLQHIAALIWCSSWVCVSARESPLSNLWKPVPAYGQQSWLLTCSSEGRHRSPSAGSASRQSCGAAMTYNTALGRMRQGRWGNKERTETQTSMQKSRDSLGITFWCCSSLDSRVFTLHIWTEETDSMLFQCCVLVYHSIALHVEKLYILVGSHSRHRSSICLTPFAQITCPSSLPPFSSLPFLFCLNSFLSPFIFLLLGHT